MRSAKRLGHATQSRPVQSSKISHSKAQGSIISQPGATIEIRALKVPDQVREAISRGLQMGKAAASYEAGDKS